MNIATINRVMRTAFVDECNALLGEGWVLLNSVATEYEGSYFVLGYPGRAEGIDELPPERVQGSSEDSA